MEKSPEELLKEINQLRIQNVELKKQLEVEKSVIAQSDSFMLEIAHDLKSPTATIGALAKLLLRSFEDKLCDQARLSSQISTTALQLENLIETINVFTYTKESPLTIEEVDIQEIFRIIRGEFLPRLQSRNIKLILPKLSKKIRLSSSEILRVFRNYIGNALNYGGELMDLIEIRYRENSKFYTFSVYNNGQCIQEKDCLKIFGPFVRHKSSKQIDGAGLGLAIVKVIADRHGGDAWAKPGMNRGVKFYISISKSL